MAEPSMSNKQVPCPEHRPATGCAAFDVVPQTALVCLPMRVADGPWHMAADETLLRLATYGQAYFRLYRWHPATVTLGYFQRVQDLHAHPQWGGYPYVRRPTGGGAILHADDVTYALALPPQVARSRQAADWHCFIHRVLADWLAAQGVPATVCSTSEKPHHFDCFGVPRSGDVVSGTNKIIGSAQRLYCGALLQHGSMHLPLASSALQALPGVLARALALPLAEQDWRPEMEAAIHDLAESKYSRPAWNERR
ncbi:MAG: hypothetical protein C4297_02295 [Gemmataceae bacterium]